MACVSEGYSEDQEDVHKAVPGDAIYNDTKGNNKVKKSFV